MDASAVGPRVPAATYRLQFNRGFTFVQAHAIVDYLDALGISDCYASSYLRAVPGSTHGYDVADPTGLNPEIGTLEDYDRWVAALSERHMGHILDLVPNHMGIARSSNPWWMDVLENGPASRFAHFFDIEWHPVKDELAEKVLIPTLGDQYGAVLERRELTLACADGAFSIRYFDDWFPVAPDTYTAVLTDDFDAWEEAHRHTTAADDIDELRSIVAACAHLPSRSARDTESIAMRAREKEVIKRRLAALLERNGDLRAFVDAAVDRFNGTTGDPRSFDRLDALLNAQSYRLAHWRVASEEINYRRFFDVNQLAALRMEDPSVFAEVHRFAFTLVARGAATGLRVDHVDGLYSPADYLQRLQARAADALGQPADGRRAIYLVVEKILGADEPLATDWPVHGTTGYEFATAVNGLFVDGRHERTLDDIYARFVRRSGRLDFPDLVYDSKKRVLHETMSGDINSLGHQLNRFSEGNRHFRDFTLYSLISTLKEVIACFPVYRTYIAAGHAISEQDRRYVQQAVRTAQRRAPGVTSLVFEFIERLLLRHDTTLDDAADEARARFIGKFQQLTAPVTAKGVEDTAFYVDNRLLSLNEVGGDPTRFGVAPAAFHAWLAERQRRWPAALSTTATHDTKRGEDVRARLDVLSELPAEWQMAVARWRALNRRLKREVGDVMVPDANEEYFLYQTLIGTWPFSRDEEPVYRDRLREYVTKALREAKVHTSWLRPNPDYERAVLRFVDDMLDPQRPFLDAFRPLQQRVAAVGIVNGLAQLLIKITAPGVPDFYQGTELWDLTFVDPDNRRPVDYAQRKQLLASLDALPGDAAASLWPSRVDGRIKLLTMARALRLRRSCRPVFDDGDYVPLQASGARAEHVFAFARRSAAGLAITCVPRLVAALVPAQQPDDLSQLTGTAWAGTRLELPAAWGITRLRDALTDCRVDTVSSSLPLNAVFRDLPHSLLTTD